MKSAADAAPTIRSVPHLFHSCALALGLVILLLSATPVQACAPPFVETHQSLGSVQWQLTDSGCELVSSLQSSQNLTAAAVAHYRRREPSAPFRMAFQVDLSGLSGLNLVQPVEIAYGSAYQAAPAISDSQQSRLFSLQVVGNIQGTSRTLHLTAACNGCPNNRVIGSLALSSLQPTISLALDMGSGADGEVRLWVDADPEGPPSLRLDLLDNALWQGLDRVGLGLSSTMLPFLNVYGGVPVRFRQINTNEQSVFWHGFEAEGPGCPLEAQSFTLPGPGATFADIDTCEGHRALPALASGSTALFGPTRVFPLQILPVQPGDGDRSVTLSMSGNNLEGSVVLICSAQCGPAARCLGGASGPAAPFTGVLAPGNYHLVVGQRFGACRNVDFNLTTTLD